MPFLLKPACRFKIPVSLCRLILRSKRPSRQHAQQRQPQTNFNATQKFLSINTALVNVEFGPSKSMSLRMLSPSSKVMNFTEQDVLESPLCCYLPFWAFLWPGGYAVTRWILEESSNIRGAVVVDVGSGCASASIGAKMQGAAVVIANDTDPFACIAAKDNSACNGASGVIPCALDLLPPQPTPHDASTAVLALEQRLALLAPHVSHRAPKFLLLGDMLYDGELGPRVLALSEAACAHGWRVVTGDPGRAIVATQGQHLGSRVACYDLPSQLRASNYGMTSASVYIAGGNRRC
jgi:predicted nicotinamide N-methyase